MSTNLIQTNMSICGKQAIITQHQGRSYFALPIESNSIPNYQKRILESHICPDLMEVRFVTDGDELWGYYDFAGYVQLTDAYKSKSKIKDDAALLSVGVILSVISSIFSIENYMFRSDGYCIDMDTIFVQPDSGCVKFAYIPADEKNNISADLAALVEKMALIASNHQWNYYADEIIDRLLNRNESFNAIERRLLEMGRELSMYSQGV